MKHVCIWLIKIYRKAISPLKPPCCRFYPTCSAYAVEAFQKRGFFVGLALSVWRILRCNPFCRPGFDPVPERGRLPSAARPARLGREAQEPLPKRMQPAGSSMV